MKTARGNLLTRVAVHSATECPRQSSYAARSCGQNYKKCEIKKMFFVSGITGKVGGATARRLLESGFKVRALVRNPQKASGWLEKGVDVHEGDLNDASAVAQALQGVEGAFVMLPAIAAPTAGFVEAKAIIESLHEALQRVPTPRLVALSSIGSEQTSGLGLITTTHLLEEALSRLPIPIAVIRAGSFLENYVHGLKAAASTGWFETYLTPTDRAISMVAATDIGNEIAHLLGFGWAGKKIGELGSPVSPDDLARALSTVLARPVQARSIPRHEWTATLEAQGMPIGTTGPFEEMEDGFNSGWITFGVPGTDTIPGTVSATQVFAEAMKA